MRQKEVLMKYSDTCVHSLNVLGAEEINVYQITLAEIVLPILQKVVLSEAALEAQFLIGLEGTVVDHCDLKGLLAEGDGIAEAAGELTLADEVAQVILVGDLLYHYLFIIIQSLNYN